VFFLPRESELRARVTGLDTWLGAAIGIVLYVASRMFAPAEFRKPARTTA
jgi:hypothetical protein